MAEIRNETPGVTKFADHEVIVVPNRLKKAVRHAGADDRDPITDSEEALVELPLHELTSRKELLETRVRLHRRRVTGLGPHDAHAGLGQPTRDQACLLDQCTA